LIIKTTFKSHFKIKNHTNKKKTKKIFVKNIIIFLLFTKIFLKGCSVNFFFNKHKANQTNLLKAPSRHKKFFHQIYYEYFQVKIFFKFNFKNKINLGSTTNIFDKLNFLFRAVGSNTITRMKFSSSLIFIFKYCF